MAYIVTGHTGTDHITSDDMSALQQGIVGTDDYLLSDNPDDFKATINADGSISLSKGEIIIQGVHARVQNGDSVSPDAGSTGSDRIDYIVGVYTVIDNIEEFKIEVRKGTSSAYPELIQDDIRNGGTRREVALFAIKFTGTQISRVERVIPFVNSLNTIIDKLNGALSNLQSLGELAEQNKSDIAGNKTLAQSNLDNVNSSLNESIKTLQTSMNEVKTKKTFPNNIVISHQLASVANNEYSDTVFRSYTSTVDSRTGKKDKTAFAIELRDKDKKEKCVFRFYSNGTSLIDIGGKSYNIPYVQKGYKVIKPSSKSTVNIGTVTIDGKNYSVKKDYYSSTANITFDRAFSGKPAVILSCHSGVAHNVSCATSNITEKGFTIMLDRANTSETGVDWVAVGYIN